MSAADTLFRQWLAATLDRWDRAMTSTPPDLAALADLPRLPGDVTLAAFVEAGREALARLEEPPPVAEDPWHAIEEAEIADVLANRPDLRMHRWEDDNGT